jgi:hypothetical protein
MLFIGPLKSFSLSAPGNWLYLLEAFVFHLVLQNEQTLIVVNLILTEVIWLLI